MVSSIAPLRYARARDLARGRRGPRRDAAVELRAGAVPAPRVRRRARARAAGPSAGAGNRRARLRRRARARRASRPRPQEAPRVRLHRAGGLRGGDPRARGPHEGGGGGAGGRVHAGAGSARAGGKDRAARVLAPRRRARRFGPAPAARAQVREPLLRRAGAGGAPEPHPRRGLDPRALGTRRGVRVRRAARRPRRHPPSRRDAGPQLERDADERGRRRRRRRRRSYRTTIETGNDRGVRVSGGRESNLRASVLAGVRVPAAAARAGNLPGRLRRDSRRFGGRTRLPRGGDRRRAGEEARH